MKHKNILDEMQEQKRLKIESTGLWLAFYGLFAAVVLQSALTRTFQLRTVMGEIVLMLVLSAYLIPCYLKHGIWSTRIKPSFRSNVIVSAIPGLFVALFHGIRSYVRYGKAAGSIAAALFSFGFTFFLTLALLMLCAYLYQRRKNKLENAPESGEDKP